MSATMKQDNPYTVLCSHCGEFICTKCLEIENKLGGLCGCDECNRYQRRLEKRHAEHLERYDHSLMLPQGNPMEANHGRSIDPDLHHAATGVDE